MTPKQTTVSPMSRHADLNCGPTDYEAVTRPRGHFTSLEERRTSKHGSRGQSTKGSQSWALLLTALALGGCECVAPGSTVVESYHHDGGIACFVTTTHGGISCVRVSP